MSTRCLITFKNSQDQVITYRHWDGYPKAVIPDLKAFLKWNKSRNNDLSYTVANYFYYMKKVKVNEQLKDKWFKDNYPDKTKRLEAIKQYSELTGFGLFSEYGDYGQEYEYIIDLETEEISQK